MAAAAVSVGAAFTARFSEMLCLLLIIIGAVGWLWAFLHFQSVEYYVENGHLIIRRGVFIKSDTRVARSDILWRSAVKFGSATLFSVIHTAAGSIVVFAEIAF